MRTKVVFRYRDGRIAKGYTLDFGPGKAMFHIEQERRVTLVRAAQLKAVFHVTSFEGDPEREDYFDLESLRDVPGLKLRVIFEDGEVMFGTTNGYAEGRPGFWLMPADEECNNERVYVFSHATKAVDAWQRPEDLPAELLETEDSPGESVPPVDSPA